MLNPLRKKKMKAITGGGKGRHLWLGSYVQKLESGSVQNKKKITTCRRDDQSAISSKEHVKYEATQTYLPVTYQHDRLHLAGKRLQQRGHGPQLQQSTPSFKESWEKKTINAYDAIRDENMPFTGFFRGYCQLLLRPSRGAA